MRRKQLEAKVKNGVAYKKTCNLFVLRVTFLFKMETH